LQYIPADCSLNLVSDPPKPQGLGSYKKKLRFWARLGRLGVTMRRAAKTEASMVVKVTPIVSMVPESKRFIHW
jgi:hypothetical protein